MRLPPRVLRLDATKPPSSIVSKVARTLGSACGLSHISRSLDGRSRRSSRRRCQRASLLRQNSSAHAFAPKRRRSRIAAASRCSTAHAGSRLIMTGEQERRRRTLDETHADAEQAAGFWVGRPCDDLRFSALNRDGVPFVQHLAKTFFRRLADRRLYVACASCFCNFEIATEGGTQGRPVTRWFAEISAAVWKARA